jgi:5-methylcytosine-specific restriction endonuclease McrA
MSGIPAKIRAKVYARDGSQCVACGLYVTSDNGRQAHHRLFLGRLGKHELANLITVCRACHDDIHIYKQAAATANGWAIPAGGDPELIPVLYWHSRKVLLSNSPELKAAS